MLDIILGKPNKRCDGHSRRDFLRIRRRRRSGVAGPLAGRSDGECARIAGKQVLAR